MIRKSRAFLLGLAVALAGAALAVDSGGFPSRPSFQYVGVGRAASSGQTRIIADNGGSGDTEIVAQTTTAGNAQFRAVNFGGINWSWGNLRSDNSFDICAASSLSTGCAMALTTSGVTFAESMTLQTATSVQINAKATGASNFGQLVTSANSGAFGSLCISDTANICESNTAADVAVIRCQSSCAGIEFNVAGVNQGVVTSSSVPWPVQTTGTFNLTISLGCTTTPTVPVSFVKVGNQVTLTFATGGSITCTSNSTGFTLNGLPAAEQTARNTVLPVAELQDNGTASLMGTMQVSASANITVGLSTVTGTHLNDGQGGTWTASGLKGINAGATITYLTN